MWAEVQGNPHLLAAGATVASTWRVKNTLWRAGQQPVCRVVTTAASRGGKAMHDSFTALGGMVPMWLMQIGEVVLGGVGSGAVRHVAVCPAGGVYRGADDRSHAGVSGEKKIDVREMKYPRWRFWSRRCWSCCPALAMMTDADAAQC